MDETSAARARGPIDFGIFACIAFFATNPLIIDSKEATESYRDFIMGEVRYNSLTKRFPERAEELFTEAEKLSRERYDHFKALEKSYEE